MDPITKLMTDQKQVMENWQYMVGDLAEKKETQARALFVAQALENQSRLGSLKGLQGVATETVDSTTSNLPMSVFPSQFAFPVVDMIFRNLVAQELVQTTTIQFPTARVLYRAYIRSSDGSSLTHSGSYGAVGEGSAVPLARMKLSFAEVSAEKYTLRTSYSQELLEDAAHYQINVQRDVIEALADEIRGELDALILDDLVNGATAGNVNWDAAGFVSSSYGLNVNEYRKTIWNAIIDARNAIYKKVYRNADYIVCGVDAAGRLEKLEQFVHLPGLTETITQAGTVRIGTLDSQFRIYKTTAIDSNTMLVGVTAMPYIWATYVPLSLTPVQWYNTQEWDVGIRTRFARKMVRSDALATVTVINSTATGAI